MAPNCSLYRDKNRNHHKLTIGEECSDSKIKRYVPTHPLLLIISSSVPSWIIASSLQRSPQAAFYSLFSPSKFLVTTMIFG